MYIRMRFTLYGNVQVSFITTVMTGLKLLHLCNKTKDRISVCVRVTHNNVMMFIQKVVMMMLLPNVMMLLIMVIKIAMLSMITTIQNV